MTTKESSNTFVVENGLNTCYIDSLLMALFYVQTFLDDFFLNQDPVATECLLLQEIIKGRFVDIVRKNDSVLSDSINEIRNHACVCGWLTETNDVGSIFEQQDVNEFYSFLAEKFGCKQIEIVRETLTETMASKDDTGKEENIPFIVLTPEEHCDQTSIKELFDNWTTNNIADTEREVFKDGKKIIENVKVLNTYKITNVPGIVPFAINRFNFNNEMTQRIYTKINIQKKIKIHTGTEYDHFDWTFHSAICHRGDTIKSGHYYALIQNCNKWFIFDDLNIPCLNEVKMDDEDTINMVMRECVFVIYIFNKNR
jgi:uncharacterized UBP type Zn finger protein